MAVAWNYLDDLHKLHFTLLILLITYYLLLITYYLLLITYYLLLKIVLDKLSKSLCICE